MEKIKKHERLKTIELDYFTGSLNTVIKYLDALKAEFPNYQELRLEEEVCYDYRDLVLHGTRLETDEEFEWRKIKARENERTKQIKKEAAKKKREEQELKQLADLIKKYPHFTP